VPERIYKLQPNRTIQLRGFDDLVRQGKVLYAGVSDAPAWWVARANTLAELRGWTPFVGLQIEYNLVERTVERTVASRQVARYIRRDSSRNPTPIEPSSYSHHLSPPYYLIDELFDRFDCLV